MLGDTTETERTVESVAAPTNNYGAKFLFRRSIGISIPLCLYSITSFMYYPVFQSLIYQKVCEQYGDQIAVGVNCSDKSASKNPQLQKKANLVSLLSNVAICSFGVFSSALVGRLGDRKSRKLALLLPLTGLLLEDITLVVQSHFMNTTLCAAVQFLMNCTDNEDQILCATIFNELYFDVWFEWPKSESISVYWLVASEALFAAFGGYMSIFSSSFAYATESVSNSPPKCRSQIISILEGIIGLGGTIGYGCSFLLNILGFTRLLSVFLVTHAICILAVLILPSIKRRISAERRSERDLFGLQLIKSVRQQNDVGPFLAIIIAFAVSYFTFMGSSGISFYYLKYRFNWDASLYGFLKGPTQGLATLNALFVFPFLRARNFTDRRLSLVGLISRGLGRLWLAVTWSTPSTFLLIFFDSFSRFAASGMRALMANIVPPENHGSMFALFAVTEAICSLLASIVFNTLFPISLSFLPQISFYILAAVMILPITILWLRHEPEKPTGLVTSVSDPSDNQTSSSDNTLNP